MKDPPNINRFCGVSRQIRGTIDCISVCECVFTVRLVRLLSLFLSLLHHPLILTLCLCMTACCLSFFFFPWPVFSSLFSSSPTFSFSPPLSSKTIKVRIIDDEEYEKNKSFFLEIGEPHLEETNEKKGGGRGLSLQRKSHIQHTHIH